jgi:hypothetical protein
MRCPGCDVHITISMDDDRATDSLGIDVLRVVQSSTAFDDEAGLDDPSVEVDHLEDGRCVIRIDRLGETHVLHVCPWRGEGGGEPVPARPRDGPSAGVRDVEEILPE